VERQNPTGPKSPSDDPKKTEPASTWISPRLRDKLGDTETGPSRDREDGTPSWLPIVLLVLVVGGAGGLFLGMRANTQHEKAEAAKKAEAARADSIASARADSTKLAAARDSVTAAQLAAAQKPGAKPAAAKTAATKPAPATAAAKPAGKTAASTTSASATKPAAKAAGAAATTAAAAAPAEPAAPRESGPFGIQVATYIVEDKASSEKDRLATATGLAGQVKSIDGSFVVLLGSFKTRAAAERAAEPLINKSLVSEAQVVALGKP
jgi:cytoskeletal protein RodZ